MPVLKFLCQSKLSGKVCFVVTIISFQLYVVVLISYRCCPSKSLKIETRGQVVRLILLVLCMCVVFNC